MQKFQRGDHVQVAKDLGPYMTHFTADCEAIVIGSYKDQYGGSQADTYTIHIKGQGRTSWYDEHQLTLMEAGRADLLDQWEHEQETEAAQKRDLDWIFANGAEVLECPHGASVQALADCFGLTNLWGSRGEGFVYFQNARGTLELARPFLEAGDKDAWLQLWRPVDPVRSQSEEPK